MKPAPFFPKFKKPSEALAAAKALIRPISRWVTGELAVFFDKNNDNEETTCKTQSKNAHAFCALGALQRVDGPVFKSARAYLREASKQYMAAHEPEHYLIAQDYKADDDHIFHVNDEVGHKAVLNTFSRAIRAAKRDGK